MTLTPVTAHTRAGRDGKVIHCPCGETTRVHHFAWSALRCQGCGTYVEKPEWHTETGKHRVA